MSGIAIAQQIIGRRVEIMSKPPFGASPKNGKIN